MYGRKAAIMREGYSMDRIFTDPDPKRSHLCYECKEFILKLHSHPWSEPTRAHLPIGQDQLSLGVAPQLMEQERTRAGRPDDWRVSESQQMMSRELTPCRLCWMIREILDAGFSGNSKQSTTDRKLVYMLKPTQFGDVYDLDPRRSFGEAIRTTRTRHLRWCLGISAVDPYTRNAPTLHLPNVIHCAPIPVPPSFTVSHDETSFVHRAVLHGRKRELLCDLRLLNTWPRLCEQRHGAECAQRPSRGGAIRLVDTSQDCIVSTHLSESQLQDYVALSYVWGDKEQPYARTAAEYAALHEKGALSRLKLANTVADAVLLVRKLGIRYLWVDALCIFQGDLSDRHEQIAQMCFVYQSAKFTIIAAAGEDCNAGLPGLRLGTRFRKQQFVQAGDYTLVNAVQIPSDKICTPRSSKWARRGWTLQEELLSSRQLIFTDEQVWWRCPCATWCEDSLLETNDRVGFLLKGQTVTPTLEARYSKLETRKFFELVVNYAQRQLTYTCDALNAFSGILSMLTDFSGEKFVWGFMTTQFERQLFWFGRATTRPLDPNAAFPTWSWVSWQGEVTFSYYAAYSPVVQCYMIQDGGDQGPVCTKVCKLNGTENPEADQTTVSIEDAMAKHKPLEPEFHLFFYTYSATFFLMPQGRLILPDLAPRYAYNKEGILLGPRPDYGYIVPTLDGSELCEKGERECILLGRRAPQSEWGEAHVLVMLIERRAGVAHRLGIADLPEEFWDLATKTWELVVLG